MTEPPWFDDQLLAEIVGRWNGVHYWNNDDNMVSHAAIGLSSIEDAQRSEPRSDRDPGDDALARLSLTTEALWLVVRDAFDLTDGELRAVIDELDRSDGTADGRRTFPPRRCPSCDARVPSDRTSCQFCGTATPRPSLFP